MANRIGLNILAAGVKDKAALLEWCARARPAAVVVMQDPILAQDILARTPNTLVVYRHWPDERDFQVAPREWVQLMLGRTRGNKRLVYYALNEPPLTPAIVRWCVEVVEEATRAGIRVCVLNLPTGNPEPAQWEIARPLLERLAGSAHFLGLHEYAGGVITSGLVGGHPTLIQPSQWPQSVKNVTCWHCGRFRFLLEYCARARITPPSILITEHGFDHTDDIKTWLQSLRKTPPFADIRGWRSLREQWALWFPAWAAEQAFYEQLIWADRVVYQNTPVVGQCIFCYGNTGGWESFDVEGARGALDALASAPDAPPPAPPRDAEAYQLLQNALNILRELERRLKP